jgi:hypothetical protein
MVVVNEVIIGYNLIIMIENINYLYFTGFWWDVLIVLVSSLIVSYILYTINEKFKTKLLIDLGRDMWVIKK